MTPSERVAEALEALRKQGWYRDTPPLDPILRDLEIGDLINLTLRLEALLRWAVVEGNDETTAPADNAFIVVLIRRLRDEFTAIQNGARSTLLDRRGPGRNSLGADPLIVRLKLAIGAHCEALADAYPTNNASPRKQAISNAVQEGGHKMAQRTVQHHIEWFVKGRAGQLHKDEWGDSERCIAEFLVEDERNLVSIVGLQRAKLLSLAALTRQAAEIAFRLGK
ncbi:MAG: hypothetical protein ABL956_16210 [Hyphomonadaceae bacterium]